MSSKLRFIISLLSLRLAIAACAVAVEYEHSPLASLSAVLPRNLLTGHLERLLTRLGSPVFAGVLAEGPK
jgi:hypothetical protein